jgi:DedD protein
MESRAKQRLTGAVILVALFVLLVPELLTGPRNSRPAAESAADEGLHRYTIDIDAQNATGQPTAPASRAAPVALPPVAEPMGAAPGLAVPGEAAVPQAPPPNNTAASPAAAPATPAPTARAPAPAASVTPAPIETPRAPPSAAPARGSFVVQLGSFGSRENAERLVRDMTVRGFTAFIAPITSNGRELYRVRVGPTRDRASAEALAAELKRAGQSGSIVPIS